jgi:hypothetical protein
MGNVENKVTEVMSVPAESMDVEDLKDLEV